SAAPGAPGAGSPATAVPLQKLLELMGHAAPDRYRSSYALAGPLEAVVPSSATAVQVSWMVVGVVVPVARSATGPGGVMSAAVVPDAEFDSPELLPASSATLSAKQ